MAARAACVLLLAGCTGAVAEAPLAAPPEAQIVYEVELLRDPPRARVRCLARAFHGRVRWAFPQGWAPVEFADPRLTEAIHVVRGQADWQAVDAFGGWLVAEQRGDVVLGWTVRLDHRSALTDGEGDHGLPYVAADHGLIQGSAIFAAPQGGRGVRAALRWRLPPGWVDHGPVDRGVDSVAALLGNVHPLGAWTSRPLRVEGLDLRLLLPAPPHAPANLADEIAAVVEQLMPRLLAAAPGPLPDEVLLVVSRTARQRGLAGAAKSHSLTLVFAPAFFELREAARAFELAHLLAHELRHVFDRQLGVQVRDARWFGEGWTDYLAWQAAVEAGFGRPDSMERLATRAVEEVEAVLAEHPDWSLAAASEQDFFAEPDRAVMTYRGGWLTAAAFDQRLGEQTRLDAWLRRFWAAQDDRGSVDEPATWSAADLLERLRRFDPAPASALAGWIEARPFRPDALEGVPVTD